MPTVTEDRDAIRDLYARYATDVDAGSARAKEWAQHYAEDGEFDTGPGNDNIVGREALEAFCAQFPTSGIRHSLTNLIIEVDGDDARCEALVIVVIKNQIVSTGVARDVLRRIDGRWQIKFRTFDPDTA